MPSSMRYPVEPFVPQRNGSGTSASRTPLEMPATNGSGRSFPGIFQRNDLGIPAPRQEEEPQTPSNVSDTSTSQPQQIATQNGNGFPPTNASREPPPHYPFLMNIGSQTYIRFEEAARFFAPQNDDTATHPPHPPQPNGHHENWAPHVNWHNIPFAPQPNGHGYHGSIDGEFIFRPQTAPPLHMLPPESLPARFRSGTVRSEYAFTHPPPPPSPYYQSGNSQYGPAYRYPAERYYDPHGQTPYSLNHFAMTPPVPWLSPVYLRKPAPKKSDDPEAKLFVGDLPVRMTTEALGDALKRRFSPFGECKVNVIWKLKPGPDGAVRSLPTGWIQYKTVFEAAKALDVAKEQGFAIGNRQIRIDRADGKRICRMWPSNPHATPTLEDFKNAIRQYIYDVGLDSAYRVLCHVSNEVEMVEKNYGGRLFTVPSVGLVFRWVEDASYSEQKLSKFTHKFRLKIEHVNSGMPGWREGPVSLRFLDALILDTGEKWQENLTLSRRCLQDKGEKFTNGKMARYPERISKKLIPRSILEHPRLKKDIFGFDPLDTLEWLDLHREPHIPLFGAINTRKMSLVNGQITSHINDEANDQTNSDVSHLTNGRDSHRINDEAGHQIEDT